MPQGEIVCKIIDFEGIRNQIESNTISFVDYKQTIDSILEVIIGVHVAMNKVERRDQTLSMWKTHQEAMTIANDGSKFDQVNTIVESLKFAMERMHKINVDTANMKLRAIAPVIKKFGVQYENTHFTKHLANGSLTLESTEKWVQKTVDELVELEVSCFPQIICKRKGLGYDFITFYSRLKGNV